MNGIETLLGSEVGIFILEAVRAAGPIIMTPLGWSTAPNRTKAALALFLAFLAHGIRPATAPALESLAMTMWLVMGELLVGLAIGFVVRCAIAVAEMCGEIMSPAIGLGVAHIFDPSTQSSTTLLATILRHLAIMLALVVGLHREVLGGLLASYQLLPVGTVSRPGAALSVIVEVSVAVLEAGTRAALPLLAILFMVQIALGFIARAAPQIQVFNVGFTLAIGIGLFVLIYVLPDMTGGFLADMSHVGPRIEAILALLGAPP